MRNIILETSADMPPSPLQSSRLHPRILSSNNAKVGIILISDIMKSLDRELSPVSVTALRWLIILS